MTLKPLELLAQLEESRYKADLRRVRLESVFTIAKPSIFVSSDSSAFIRNTYILLNGAKLFVPSTVMNVRLSIVDDVLVRQRTTANALGAIWFVHAFGDSGLCYEELLTSKLGERFNLYVPDFPGFGVSPLQPNRTSLESASEILIELISAMSPSDNIYLVAHSVTGIIGTWAARELGDQAKAYFNIEGNLVTGDTYFTGQVANYDSALRFKDDFVKQVYDMASDDVALKRYFAGVCLAHPEALMGWGQSAVHHSASAADEFSALGCAKLYYWGERTTPEDKQQFIESARLPNLQFHDSGHWPMIDQPQRCSEDVARFFLANAGP